MRVLEEDLEAFDDLLKFRRFRLNVIEFLKLPLDVSEPALRDSIKRSSAALFRNYEERAARARAKPNQTVAIEE